ncbi:MerR family transcriptional regulator [Intestinimonas sp. MSJ-38]|uniref:MerR family transcriptional regulator n=1 Tax=Intestinimonas sp. MSJ-38 TaxID=2841532 RepID=UPI001C0F8194|nr:MerR family transcriptional regulator [Intestinimonas sp. MSJ-38]MBU5431714.1 MerR family transcriptional regulator [Intestinimonas sp. MSJ-38]
MEKTLRQVCTELKVSRRAVQGYEKAGLVAASGKNKYGYLLYGEPERERIRLVRFYQQLGFRLKEIKELLDADGPVRKATLQAKAAELEKEDIHLRELIRQAKEYIAAL